MSNQLRRKDALETVRVLRRRRCACLVVDHYGLGYGWEKHVCCKLRTPIVTLEDLPVRSHFSNILIDPSVGRVPRDYLGKIPENSRLLLGPRYALVPRKFSLLRKKSVRYKNQILISMGAMDHSNATMKIIHHLRCLPEVKNVRLRVALGAKAPWRKKVRKALSALCSKAKLQINVQNMAALMRRSRIGILAPGTVAWEALAAGLPSLLLATVPHHVSNARNLHRMGCARYLGMVSEASPRLLRMEIQTLMVSRQKRDRLGSRAKKLVDGNGPRRVAQAINKLVRKHV